MKKIFIDESTTVDFWSEFSPANWGYSTIKRQLDLELKYNIVSEFRDLNTTGSVEYDMYFSREIRKSFPSNIIGRSSLRGGYLPYLRSRDLLIYGEGTILPLNQPNQKS